MGQIRQIKRTWFITITIALIIVKSVVGALMFYYEHDRLQYKFHFKEDFSVQYSGDEFEIVKSAFYYNRYGRIMTDSPFHSFARPRVRPAGLYLTAFRPKAQIMLHSLGLKLTEAIEGRKFNSVSDIPGKYLHYFGVFMFLLKTIMFPFSVFFFYRILKLLNPEKILVQTGTWAYILIPSVFLFIGWFDTWENYALYSFIIVFYFVLAETIGVATTGWKYISVPVLIITSTLVRPHLIIFYIALFSFLFFYSLLRSSKRNLPEKRKFSLMALIALICIETIHIPIFIQNHNYFGQYVLSTQSKFEFFQGHNPFARGSWYPAVYMDHKDYFDSIFRKQPLVNASELEEGEYYQKMSVEWIKHNPGKEMVLEARKLAGYFIPWNFINHRMNIYTILLHLSFFIFSLRFVIRTFIRRNLQNWETNFLLFVPPLMSIFLTLTFFTGERWRYFAEPFFLLMGIILIDVALKRRKLTEENAVSLKQERTLSRQSAEVADIS